MGLSEGCAMALILLTAYDICGTNGASQAMGFVLGLYSFPFLLGPPVSGQVIKIET